MRRVKKGKRKISLSLKLFYLLLLSFLVVSFSIARYRTTYNAMLTGNTANWVFEVNENSLNEQITINLADTTENSTYYAYNRNVIAPGAKGNFDITIDCTNCKVALDYEIILKTNSNSEMPREMMFYSEELNNGNAPLINVPYSDGTFPEEVRKISGTISLQEMQENPTKTFNIDWLWQVNIDIDESGFEGQNFYIDIFITGTQSL